MFYAAIGATRAASNTAFFVFLLKSSVIPDFTLAIGSDRASAVENSAVYTGVLGFLENFPYERI